MKELQSCSKSFMNVAVGTDPYMSETDSASIGSKRWKQKNKVKDILHSKSKESSKQMEKKF